MLDNYEEQGAWILEHSYYFLLHTCDDGWDYTVYDSDFIEVDGGQLDCPEMSMKEAAEEILGNLSNLGDMTGLDRIAVDYDEILETADAVEQERMKIAQAQMQKGDSPLGG
jgi:hypothetical protein